MKTALLWYDDNKATTLVQKVQAAAKCYYTKWKRKPTRCYVHPSALTDGPIQVAGVRVSALPTALVNHFWIGVEEERSADG